MQSSLSCQAETVTVHMKKEKIVSIISLPLSTCSHLKKTSKPLEDFEARQHHPEEW